MKSYEVTLKITEQPNNKHIISVAGFHPEKDVIIFKSDGKIHLRHKALDIKKLNLKDKTIYRYPKLSLPRNKVDVLKEKYNLTVTRNADTADYKIISDEYLESLLGRKWHDTVYLANFIEYYNNTKQHWDERSVEILLNTIKNEVHEDAKVCLTIKNSYSWSYTNTQTYDVLRGVPAVTDKSYYIESEELLKNLINSTNLVYDTDLAGVTVEDSTILTEKDYLSLCSMIESNDTDNINMALEIMANCNVEKCIDILALIYYQHHNVLKDRSSNWNSINVKTFRKRFAAFIPYGNRTIHYYDNLVKNLLKEDFLTEFAVKTISVKVLDYMMTSVGFDGKSSFDIKLEDIKLKPEIREKIKVNNVGREVLSQNAVYLPF